MVKLFSVSGIMNESNDDSDGDDDDDQVHIIYYCHYWYSYCEELVLKVTILSFSHHFLTLW